MFILKFFLGGDTMNREKLACNCMNVTYGMIEDAVNDGATTFEEVQEATGCSMGCGKCEDFIRSFVSELVSQKGDD